FVLLSLFLLLSYFLTGFFKERAARQEVMTLSWAVTHKVIIIDPGQGGGDPELMGNNSVLEKDISLAIAKKLAVILGQAGAMVLMTKETDMSEPGTMSVQKEEDLKADLYISIHVNNDYSAAQHGAQTFVQSGFHNSKLAGQSIQSELSGLIKNADRLAKEVDYYVTKDAIVPAVLVEAGFITNEKERRLLQDQVYQNKVAWAIYAGIVKYFYQLEKDTKRDIINVFKEQEPDLLREP
ncbi:MAG: N-acetylmuramoyl-L-alanine amidase, partial [Desulfotomaculaceae bacterium]|nr:N-acetylmuramoyl-L-alanine amidase [Desulfotomaculaceae bacterium]